jgi:C-terminal processing protease CtpA/Prc
MRRNVSGVVLFILVLMGICTTGYLAGQTSHERAVANIEAFARLYGYVRFFHPTDEAARMDWQRFAVYGVKTVESARTRAELKQALERLFLPIAPALVIYDSEKPAAFSAASITPPEMKGMKEVAWQHLGVGLGRPRSIYKSIRVNRENVIVPANDFGTISNKVDAVPFRGKAIKLRAAVKAEVQKEAGQGQLWLRVDRPGRQLGFFDNMDDRPVRSSDWQYYEISGTVADDAENIYFGCFLVGVGKVWVDDVQVYLKEADAWQPVEIPNADFEVAGPGGSPKEWMFNDAMYSFQIINQTAVKGNKSLLIEHKTLVYRDPIFEQVPRVGEAVNKELGSGLSCIVPLALYGSREHTYPPAPEEALARLRAAIEQEVPKEFSADDLCVRLAGIVISWNIFQHFFPYFDAVGVDWPTQLTRALEWAYQDKDRFDFLKTLQKFTAALKDGHVRVSLQGAPRLFYAPLDWEWLEGQLVVTRVLEQKSDIRPGDIVLEIDGLKAGDALAHEGQYISAATPGWKQYRALGHLLLGTENAKKSLKILRGDQILLREIVCGSKYQRQISFSQDKYKEIEEGILYLNLGQITWPEIEKLMPQLEKAKSIICDLRGYPMGNHRLISHLLKEKDTSTSWMRIPQIAYPDYEQVTYANRSWKLEPLEPHLTAKVIFIVDGRAISYAESFMGFIEHYKLATIIGQPTAGTNGNVNVLQLPGGYRLTFTGMRVAKHDGSQHHGVGIIPHILLNRTIKGVKEGRDEFLDKAIQLARHQTQI